MSIVLPGLGCHHLQSHSAYLLTIQCRHGPPRALLSAEQCVATAFTIQEVQINEVTKPGEHVLDSEHRGLGGGGHDEESLHHLGLRVRERLCGRQGDAAVAGIIEVTTRLLMMMRTRWRRREVDTSHQTGDMLHLGMLLMIEATIDMGRRSRVMPDLVVVLQLHDQSLAWRILESVQLVTRVLSTARVGEDCAAHRAVVARVSELDLAEVEAGHEVEQPPELVLGDPDAADHAEDTGPALTGGCVGQGSVR